MTLQNCLALDLLLLHEHGICGYLKLNNKKCCVHIPNVTKKLERQLGAIQRVAKSSQNLTEAMETGWLNKILHGLGFSLTGWLEGLLQNLIIFIIMIIIVSIMFGCLKSLTTRQNASILCISCAKWKSDLSKNRISISLKGGTLLQ